ncbi:MAG TPA: single-stranded DNA-binding protein [Alteromonas australica]|uniref:Single-stranded DNA-binding protein n=1 Tax=Alteromonas australica TaxID=589873 RepID=A0A350P1M4_9ALTE|nr:single-stranded DNA-binding protein [Alteromonas australica]|tara:strand:- start:520 stop:852 length:333 start_codon:yes stop_codon:yes gene_type:complete
MAQATLSGTVVCKEGTPPVSLRNISDSFTIAEFSVRDTEYFYYKGDDKPGQFYRVQVGGKQAEIIANSLERGDFVSVTGQLIQNVYNDKTYLNVRDARVNQPYKEKKEVF